MEYFTLSGFHAKGVLYLLLISLLFSSYNASMFGKTREKGLIHHALVKSGCENEN